MNNGNKEDKINILISILPNNYNENFINNLLDKRNRVICNIIKRVFLESFYWFLVIYKILLHLLLYSTPFTPIRIFILPPSSLLSSPECQFKFWVKVAFGAERSEGNLDAKLYNWRKMRIAKKENSHIETCFLLNRNYWNLLWAGVVVTPCECP